MSAIWHRPISTAPVMEQMNAICREARDEGHRVSAVMFNRQDFDRLWLESVGEVREVLFATDVSEKKPEAGNYTVEAHWEWEHPAGEVTVFLAPDAAELRGEEGGF